jgi:hypothetical protein
MERSNMEMYYLSITPMKLMYDEGLITKQDYQKAESFLAEKYCIKKGNLYRLNHLTIPRNRVIYMIPEEEANSNEKNYNEVRRITQVSKKN